MKKIDVSAESYPCIPEKIFKSSAKSLVSRLEKAFSHIDMDKRLISVVVSEAISNVDEIVKGFLGGSCIAEKELRLFVDVTLEKRVMGIISSNLSVAEGEPIEE
jgi:hypothetical protein